jgi:hypothetical protein
MTPILLFCSSEDKAFYELGLPDETLGNNQDALAATYRMCTEYLA